MDKVKRNRPNLPKIVLSFGIGRLHFVQASEALTRLGVDLSVLQGWVPGSKVGPRILDAFGRLLGSPHMSVGMSKRTMPFLPSEQNIGLALPEFYTQLLLQANRRLGLPRGYAARAGWRAFGRASARQLNNRLKDRQILHVRSGAGYKVIPVARDLGMKIIVDHSIAHPAFLERALKSECEAVGLPFWTSPRDPFWSQVLLDCQAADRLLVNSHFVKNTFVEEGMDPSKIDVVYLGVRKDFIGLKEDYSVGSCIQLLFTGQFGARKGARYLIDALERLKATGVDFHLTALGDATEGRRILEGSSIADQVSLPGFVPQDQLKTFLASSDMYIFPSLAEGCASSAMEALAAGLPVIATEETGLPAKSGREAIIVRARSGTEIAEGITSLQGDRSLRESLGRSAAEMIAKSFTWDEYGNAVQEIYRNVLTKSEP